MTLSGSMGLFWKCTCFLGHQNVSIVIIILYVSCDAAIYVCITNLYQQLQTKRIKEYYNKKLY